MSDEKTVDYSQYTTEELLKMYDKEKHLANSFDISQLVKKILLNSLYGSCANKFFPYYERDLARSITLLGQVMINKAAKANNEFMSEVLEESVVKDRRIYSDTDSVTGDSLVYVKNNSDSFSKISISKLYDNIDKKEEFKTIENKFIKDIKNYNIKTISISNNNIFETDIKYIMKHKTKKHLYNIKINNKSIKVTEDHSIMFIHDNKLVKGTINDIKKGDEIVEIVE